MPSCLQLEKAISYYSLMPEKLVAVFSPNEQNLAGLLEMVRTATEYRRHSGDLRPLSVFPLPSRIDSGEQVDRTSWLLKFENEFERLIAEVYGVEDCSLSEYFSEVQLPYVTNQFISNRTYVILAA